MGVVQKRLEIILNDIKESLTKNDQYKLLQYMDCIEEKFFIEANPRLEEDGTPAAYYPGKDKIYVALPLLTKTFTVSMEKGGYKRIPLPREEREYFDRTWKINAGGSIAHEIAHMINQKSGLMGWVNSMDILKSTAVLDNEHNLSFVLLSLELGGRLSTYLYSKNVNRLIDFGHAVKYSDKLIKSANFVEDFLLEFLNNGKERNYSENTQLVDFRGSGIDYKTLAKGLAKERSKKLGIGNPGRRNGIMFISDDKGVLLDYGGRFYACNLKYNKDHISIDYSEINPV